MKSIAQKKIDGTYRKDRDGKKEAIEKKFSEIETNVKSIEPPDTLTNDYVKQAYKEHTGMLIKLNLLQSADVVQLNLMYETLQQIIFIKDKLKELDLLLQSETYLKLNKQYIALINLYNSLAKLYYVSPVARLKLQLDNLTVQKYKTEVDSAISKVMGRKFD